jgi:hypothetical protein
MSTGATGQQAGDGGGVEPVIGFVSRVLVPAGLLTAVLYYFGYVREQALFSHFGIDLGIVGFSTTDYLVRSTSSVFFPLATVLVIGVAAVAVHHLLVYLLSRLPARRRGVVWAVLAVTAFVLLVAGVVGLQRRANPAIGPLFAPVALASGAVLLQYTADMVQLHQPTPDQLSTVLASTQKVRRGLLAALALVAVFWVMTTVAQQRGVAAANAVEISLLVSPQAVVYSRVRLQITGPGVTLSKLDGSDAAFAYRYSGLRPLIHAGGRWFLLPAGWTPDNGATVIVLPDSVNDVRVDLSR